MPFSGAAASSQALLLRDGMVDLLYQGLDGFEGWTVVHPRSVATRVPASGNLALADARGVARSLRAGRFIMGTATQVGPRMRLLAEVFETTTGRRLGSAAAVDADIADPIRAVDSLTAVLATRFASQTRSLSVRPAEHLTRSPSALRLYLAAERAGRAGNWDMAADSLDAAIRNDSTFAIAMLRRVEAASFGARAPTPERDVLLQMARARARHLSPRQRALIDGQLAVAEGNTQAGLAIAAQLSQSYPDDAEAAYVTGDALFHLGVPQGRPPADALATFTRGLATDSSLVENLYHAIPLAWRVGDTSLARVLQHAAERRAPASAATLHSRFGLDALLGVRDTSEWRAFVARLRDAAPANFPGSGVRVMGIVLQALADRPGDALGIAANIGEQVAGPNAPRLPVMRRHLALVRAAQGRWREAYAQLAHAAQPIDTATMYLLPLMTSVPAAAMPSLPNLANLAFEPTTQFGPLMAMQDERLIDSLVPNGWSPSRSVALREGLHGLAALRRGDTIIAARRLRAAMAHSPGLVVNVPDGLWSLAALELGRLELRAGALESAARLVAAKEMAHQGRPQTQMVLVGEFQELRAQIAEARGARTEAIAAWREVISIWREADPEIQWRVARAREALARLGG